MKVSVIGFTPNPLSLVSKCAGVSHGKSDSPARRAEDCFENGHMSVFEHASVTFMVEGISRACSHQLVRHRLASYTQLSQRYTEPDFGAQWYVIPESFIERGEEQVFRSFMTDCAEAYMEAVSAGIRPEDARFMLPEAAKTDIAVTMNWRELYHFFDVRLCEHAQWEVRNVAEAMMNALIDEGGQLQKLAMMWEDLR